MPICAVLLHSAVQYTCTCIGIPATHSVSLSTGPRSYPSLGPAVQKNKNILTKLTMLLRGTISGEHKTCQGDHSDRATTCHRIPLQPGPRDAISRQPNELAKETTWLQRPLFEGPLSDHLDRFHRNYTAKVKQHSQFLN